MVSQSQQGPDGVHVLLDFLEVFLHIATGPGGIGKIVGNA
jgi:hypothetical protein